MAKAIGIKETGSHSSPYRGRQLLLLFDAIALIGLDK
jgi:hypothetical protein